MKKIFTIIIAVVIPSIIFAQKQFGNLTVFSDDGDKFYLVLNGEKQNENAQSNIRVEELPQPYYRAKIIFENQSLGEITKTLPVSDVDDKMMDVTYRIRKDKNGKVKISQYSSAEVTPEFIIPSGTYVRRYGQTGGTGGISQTTTSTTTSNTMNANLNVPGINMNISINDPNSQVLTTTTTTTSHSSTNSNTNTQSNSNSQSNTKCSVPMKSNDFAAAKKTVSESSFDDTKLSTSKSIASSNCLTSDQVAEICKLLSFEESKLTFAKFAFKYVTDPNNYFKVNSVFSFSASKEDLNSYISGQ